MFHSLKAAGPSYPQRLILLADWGLSHNSKALCHHPHICLIMLLYLLPHQGLAVDIEALMSQVGPHPYTGWILLMFLPQKAAPYPPIPC